MEAYGELADFLCKQWITVEVSPYTFVPDPAPGAPDYQAFREAFWGSGSEAHGRLKWQAWNWLREQGETEPLYEYATAHGRADVAAPGIRYVAECGDTAPDKVVQALTAGGWKAFALFPWPHLDEKAWRAEDCPLPAPESLMVREVYVFRLTDSGAKGLEDYLHRRLWHENAAAAVGL